MAIKYNSARLGKHCTLHCARGDLQGTQGRNGESKVEINAYGRIESLICIDLY